MPHKLHSDKKPRGEETHNYSVGFMIGSTKMS